MPLRPFTVTMAPEEIEGIQRLAASLGLSASGILRAAALAALDDPGILLRRTHTDSKQQSRRSKLTAMSGKAS